MKTKIKSWKKTFTIIYSGQVFSIVGSSAAQFAIIWWLTVTTGSAITLTVATIVGFLPLVLIGPFAGVWIDHYNRKKVMILADGLIAVSSIVLAIAFMMGTPSLPFVYLILFIRGLGGTFHGPAMQAAIPMLVPEDKLMKVGGWGQLVNSGSYMLGPVLGAGLMAIMPIATIMFIDVIGAAFAITALLFVKIPDVIHHEKAYKVFSDLKEGLKEIGRNKPLRTILIPILLATVVYMPLGALFPLMVLEHFGGTAWHNGLVEFVFAGGLLVSSLIMGVWGGLKKQFLMIALSIGALGLLTAISGALPSNLFVVFVIVSFLMGLTGAFFNVPYMAYIQRTVPEELMGKVISLSTSAMGLAMPIGLILAGPVSETLGVSAWFLISGIAMVFVGVLCYFITRKYD